MAALIAIEKALQWRRVATWGTATVLLALAVVVVAAPHSVPGLVVDQRETRERERKREIAEQRRPADETYQRRLPTLKLQIRTHGSARSCS